MKLKPELNVEIFININGHIAIEQNDLLSDDLQFILLSPHQFKKLAIWFDVNEEQINEAWNDGFVFNDDEDENNNEEKNDEIKKYSE
jgi:hypothetical protein